MRLKRSEYWPSIVSVWLWLWLHSAAGAARGCGWGASSCHDHLAHTTPAGELSLPLVDFSQSSVVRCVLAAFMVFSAGVSMSSFSVSSPSLPELIPPHFCEIQPTLSRDRFCVCVGALHVVAADPASNR